MFTRKTFAAFTLIVGLGATCSVAQVQRKKAPVAPLSSTERKIHKCEVHGTLLKVEDVKIAYGLIGFPAGYYQAQQRNFPHARSTVMGGCVISPSSPKFQTVKYCPRCRAAEKRWSDAHKPTQPAR